MHLKAMPSTSFMPLTETWFSESEAMAGSKQSDPRPSATRRRTQSVRSTPPSEPETTSPAHLPVRSSSSTTPKAYTSDLNEGDGFLDAASSGAR
ncbi:Os07g0145500 [Oryza sativa Japonica Group]|uniref:Os07g0145500 protein n=1 Tax=Oryza sativa subsp. japonica TaxID=39947 RepID=A0A0P0X292_ORYSJ|nr:hypothetical protein EE612_037101 [Oryza sativa]BAT00045.1 Os07g0145500 [Oryza sativa Japonica Group]